MFPTGLSLTTPRLAPTHVVVDLDCERPVATKFLGHIVRELRIRFYKAKTFKSYRCALTGFLRWFGNRPHLITREDVRCYLGGTSPLVDTG